MASTTRTIVRTAATDLAAAITSGIINTSPVPVTSGGVSIFRSLDLDESEEEVKATAGQVYWIHVTNHKATALYLKLYNATAANTTVGTTTPIATFALPAPAGGGTTGNAQFLQFPQGLPFTTALSAAVTTGVADSDTGAPGANEATITIGYK
jgi:hypothetical protein